MAENQESQIKQLVSKKEISTDKAIENGITNALKKSLPIITKTTSAVVTAPAYIASQAIISSVDTLKTPIENGFSKIKDIGSDLIIDIKETAKDILSPGALVTTMTGSPLLGSFIGNSLESSFDKIKNLKDSLFKREKKDIDIDDIRKTSQRTAEASYDSLTKIEAGVDVTNDLLLRLVAVLSGFRDIYTKDAINTMKYNRLRELKDAEARREELDRLSKLNTPQLGDKSDKKEKEGFLEKIKKNITIFWSSLVSIFSLLGKGLKIFGKAFLPIMGIFEFIRSLLSGEDIIKSLTNAGKEMLKSFTMLFTLPIDLIAKAFGKDWDLTGWFNNLFDAAFDGLSAIFHGNWDEVSKIADEKLKWLTDGFEWLFTKIFEIGDWIGSFFTGIYDSIVDGLSAYINFYKEYIIDPIANGFKKIWDIIKSGFDAYINFYKEYIIDPIFNFFKYIGDTFSNIKGKVKSWLPSWLGGDSDDEKIEKNKEAIKPILESSKQISELQRPIQTTIINNNTNNMTQMSNNNAIGKTNMIVGSSLRNNDPTFNQCLFSNAVPNM